MQNKIKKNNTILNDNKKQLFSLIAEQCLLGSLIIKNDGWQDIKEILIPSDFYFKNHQIIYKAILEILESGCVMDLILLNEKLMSDNTLQNIGGYNYISEITENTPSANNNIYYANIIKNQSILRKVINLTEKIQNDIYFTNNKNYLDIIKYAEVSLLQLFPKSIDNKNSPKNIIHYLDQPLFISKNSTDGLTGIDTGYKELNKLTLGFQKSDLIIIAARPAMGKTTLALNICANVAMKQEKPVLIFSLEMQALQILQKLISSLSRVEQNKIKLNQLTDKESEDIKNVYKILSKKKNIFIDDSTNITPQDLINKATNIYKENDGLSLIMIDYLQLIKFNNNFSLNRNLEISEISRTLKKLAKEFNIPIISLSQLNRYLEQRSDKRPINSDLRESGALEQDADLILFIYRDEAYNKNSQMKGMAEIIIGKNRNGPSGNFFLKFNETFSNFEDL